MHRRSLLSAIGVAAATTLAGCSSEGGTGTQTPGNAPYEHPGTLDETFVSNGDYPADEDPGDGYPPEFPDPPSAPDVDDDALETLTVNEETVKLVSIDAARAWYLRSEARFVDARGLTQYNRSHLYGSVLSTAQQDSDGGGIDGWPTDERIVTYCGCPHHLSSLRAAGLSKSGYGNVYVIDEGFGEWSDQGYPMAGTTFGDQTSNSVSEWQLDGDTDPSHQGEYAWASMGRQYEAAPIGDDGSFSIQLKFSDVTERSPVQVSTPEYTLTRPLGELASTTIRGR